MLLLLLCGLPVLIGAWWGYRTGALAQVVGFLVLAACGAAAVGLARAGITHPLLRPIPVVAQPYVITIVGTVLLFAVLSVLARWELRALDRAAVRRAKKEGVEKPQRCTVTRSPLNRWTGLLIGSLKGGVVAAGLLFGLHVADQAARMAEQALAPVASAPGAPAEDPPPVQSILREAGEAIRRSPVGPLADRVSPVKERQVEAIGKLGRLSRSDEALRRLAGRSEVRELLKNPKVQALSRDPAITRAVTEKRWGELLNRKEVLDLARDTGLRKWLESTDFSRMVQEAEQKPAPAQAPSDPADR